MNNGKLIYSGQKGRDLAYNVELPQRTKTYVPISNKDLIDGALDFYGQDKPDKETYHFNSDYKSMIFTHIYKGIDHELGMAVTGVNSYDRSAKVQLVAGTIVFICSNGLIVTEDAIGIMRYHKGNVDEELNTMFNNVMPKLNEHYAKSIESKEKMKEIHFSQTDLHSLIGDLLLNTKIISHLEIPHIKNSIEVGNFKDNNLWCNYNHITNGIKYQHTGSRFNNYLALHEKLKKEYL